MRNKSFLNFIHAIECGLIALNVLALIATPSYDKTTNTYQTKQISEKQEKTDDVTNLFPEEDVIFEQAVIEKTKNEDGTYQSLSENVSILDFDCYVERAIEKGFKERKSNSLPNNITWIGETTLHKDVYILYVLYIPEKRELSASLYKEV